jgi:two-component system NarL family sensor kinase
LSSPEESEHAGLAQEAAAETERLVAWLRLLAIALIGAGQALVEGNPTEEGFFEAILVFSVWGVALLAWVYLRPVTKRVALVSTVVDVAAITALAVLSGGAFSQARLAYFLIPVAVAFRFRPAFTAGAAALTVVAYLTQAFWDSASSQEEAERFIALHAAYLAWVGLAAVLLSYVLARRTRRVAELAALRQRLIADAMTAEERERKLLAEGLHDHAIQNLLSARHDLEEVQEEAPHQAVRRADAAIAQTVEELRDAVFELHPYVLEQAGLEAALRAVGQRAARRGGFHLHVDLHRDGRHPQEALMLSVARELFANAVAHARARNVRVGLATERDELVLTFSDDGHGFDAGTLPERLAEGHIGLASQRERVRSAGGQFAIRSMPEQGTRIEVRLPGQRLPKV